MTITLMWLANNLSRILSLAGVHIVLSIVPLICCAVISIPLGWLLNRCRLIRGAALALCSLLYAIPSLPLLIAIPGLIGTGILNPVNLEIALTLYAVALMTQFAADAFQAIPRATLTAADAMGYATAHRFFNVDLPLAVSSLIAGLRVVSVSTVSLVTVGSVIGVSSLGSLFVEGYQRAFIGEIVIGIVGTLLIAVVLDRILAVIGYVATPWVRSDQSASKPRGTWLTQQHQLTQQRQYAGNQVSGEGNAQ